MSSTSAGHLLLRHPHFVGTIHSFVNEFLAVPWLRSKGWPIKAIDTEIALNDRWRRLPWGTKRYLEKQHDNLSSLTYTQPDHTGGGKNAYPVGKDTYQQMLSACQQSSEAGYYCFDEMFVWASELLDRFPDVIEAIRGRFPLVFIDEVQDNSELQSAFLHRLFTEGDGAVVRQRFGDSNQAIYHRSGASGAVTDSFPGPCKADLPNSFRFGQVVADFAAPLGVRPQAIVGQGPTTSRINHAGCQGALFPFDDASVLGVLPAYAEYLIEAFSPEALARGDFTAVAGVHSAEKDDHLPRFMGALRAGLRSGRGRASAQASFVGTVPCARKAGACGHAEYPSYRELLRRRRPAFHPTCREGRAPTDTCWSFCRTRKLGNNTKPFSTGSSAADASFRGTSGRFMLSRLCWPSGRRSLVDRSRSRRRWTS
ncbi:MAG: Conjugative transfer ATP-dependent DNA helicase [uncultured Paraburkholderia sp.]|nr:MAG: Conjugative transfer ATP-dependent DNA helicase [uncultured Paraburkholderia sp.]CAH2924600.1 MAG: Conjugative transfer ATP-dependent DNA helicase [uncultured Paraburkholderia sp.]